MGSRIYRLTVEGELGDHMESAFPEMLLTRDHGTTALTGEIRDQAELQAVLRRLTDFGLTLLETKALEDGPADRPEPRPASSATRGRR